MALTIKPPILVVDDEPDILFSLEALLRRNFETFTAQTGAKALELLQLHSVQVIMTDQRMPEITGVELLRRSRAICPDTIRILFTGYADIKAVVDAVNQVEVYRYLIKPWDPDELLVVLAQACSHYQAQSERSRLLADTRAYLAQWLALPAEQKGVECSGAGEALLGRIEEALGKGN